MTAIGVGARPFAAEVIVVGRKRREPVRVVPGRPERVLRLSVEPTEHLPAQGHLYRIRRLTTGRPDLPNRPKGGIGSHHKERRLRRVDVARPEEVVAARARIADRQRRLLAELMVHVDAELHRLRNLHARRQSRDAGWIGGAPIAERRPDRSAR